MLCREFCSSTSTAKTFLSVKLMDRDLSNLAVSFRMVVSVESQPNRWYRCRNRRGGEYPQYGIEKVVEPPDFVFRINYELPDGLSSRVAKVESVVGVSLPICVRGGLVSLLALARLVHSMSCWNMRMVFFRVPFYFLCILRLIKPIMQVKAERVYGSSLKKGKLIRTAEARDSYAQGFLALVYAHGDKVRPFRSRMPAEAGGPFLSSQSLAWSFRSWLSRPISGRWVGGGRCGSYYLDPSGIATEE